MSAPDSFITLGDAATSAVSVYARAYQTDGRDVPADAVQPAADTQSDLLHPAEPKV